MLINIDCPLNLLQRSHNFNDFDVAHAHLFEEYPQYFSFIKSSIDEGRTVILDRGSSDISIEQYKHWINELDPSYYIVPPAENGYDTISALNKFECDEHPCNKIAVIKGNEREDIINCYHYMDGFLDANDIIAFENDNGMGRNRSDNIMQLRELNVINRNRKHHIIGGMLPVEHLFIRDYDFVYSCSTDMPLLLTIDEKSMSPWGCYHDVDITFDDIFDIPSVDEDLFQHNVATFFSYFARYINY